ncbi:MAG: Cys-tRNA(Pro) deacylase [Bacteroidales bacterium]|nr:Cys-tRNA(Pro) deacylase [Bacteroidales bacterium]MDD5816621.1 Cys-tRNA(Pro) deacylase [Bacteroidales bacterium]MDY4520184.1 Cys-tRNA(Pro) deacylase [Bacteroidales bacterium]
MATKIAKTNVARLLDKAKVSYELRAYDYDPDDLNATHAADSFGLEYGQVFKTLVLRGDRNGLFVCVVPSNSTVDLKKAAKASGNKSAEMLHVKDLLENTGYIRGGCSPLGMKKHFPTYIDQSVEQWQSITVSAGQRGLMVQLAPQDIIRVAQMTVADIAKFDTSVEE